MWFKIIKSEGDPGFVVLSKEVGELSTLPVKISQLSSYQDDMDREPWKVGAVILDLYILSPFNTITHQCPVAGLTEILAVRGIKRLLGLKSWKLKLLLLVRSLVNHGLYRPWNSPGQNTRLGRHSLLQGIFPNQGSSSGISHWRWILHQLSHKGSQRMLEWVAYPFSTKASLSRNWTDVYSFAG